MQYIIGILLGIISVLIGIKIAKKNIECAVFPLGIGAILVILGIYLELIT